MVNDPIVEAVREVKEKLAAAFNYDVHAMCEDMRKREAEHGDRLIRQPPRKTPSDQHQQGVSRDAEPQIAVQLNSGAAANP